MGLPMGQQVMNTQTPILMKNGVVRYLLASVGMIIIVVALILGGISTCFFLKYKPQLSHLREAIKIYEVDPM